MSGGDGSMSEATTVGNAQSWAPLSIVAVAQFLVLLDSTVANVALPTIARDLQLGTSAPWVLDAYTVTFGALLLLGGRLADTFGHRRVFTAGTALFTLASVACTAASTGALLITARAVQGIGAAALSPAALAVITRTYRQGHQRSVALGVWAALGGLGATVGVIAGGLAVYAWGWRSAFALNVPIGIAVTLLVNRTVPADERTSRRNHALDLIGAASATLGSALVVLAILMLNDHDTSWVLQTSLGCIAVLVLIVFCRRQRGTTNPLVPPILFTSRGLSAAAIGQLLLGATQLATLYLLSVEAQDQLHMSPLAAGTAFLPMGLAAIVAAVLAPRLTGRFGLFPVWSTALGLGLLGLIVFGLLDGHGSYLTSMLGPALLVGASLPTTSYAGTTLGTAALDPSTSGSASSLLTAGFQIGGALGVAGAAIATTNGLTMGYLIAAAFPLLGLINLVRIHRIQQTMFARLHVTTTPGERYVNVRDGG